MIAAILFDKDGTLLDFEATWGPLYRVLAVDLAGGDAARATAMLAAGGLDRRRQHVAPVGDRGGACDQEELATPGGGFLDVEGPPGPVGVSPIRGRGRLPARPGR